MTVVIINPMSGPGLKSAEARGRDRLARAQRVLRAAGIPHRIEVTLSPGHGAAIAREALSTGASLVCAWGGDGTMNEIASVLAFSPVPLGLVPNGSGNGLARELGVSLDPATALRQALAGTDRPLDAGEIGGRLFFNVAGVGFDAHVARLFNEGRGHGRRRGLTSYVVTSLVELFRYEAARYDIRIPAHAAADREALMVVIANTAQYGNGARIAPQARPDDGRLDLVIVDTKSAVGNIWRARRLFDGTLARASGVTIQTIDTADIAARMSVGAIAGNGYAAPQAATPNGAALWFHVDGEPVEGHGALHVRVHPRALRVRVPNGH